MYWLILQFILYIMYDFALVLFLSFIEKQRKKCSLVNTNTSAYRVKERETFFGCCCCEMFIYSLVSTYFLSNCVFQEAAWYIFILQNYVMRIFVLNDGIQIICIECTEGKWVCVPYNLDLYNISLYPRQQRRIEQILDFYLRYNTGAITVNRVFSQFKFWSYHVLIKGIFWMISS